MKARIMMLIMAVALVALPTMAQQEWQSTSAMQGSGSAYSAQVTAVGAAEVTDMATTTTDTYSPAQAPTGRRKTLIGGGEYGQSDQSPIGDAWPLVLFAALFAIVITIKKHKQTIMKKNLKTWLFIAALLTSNGAWADITYYTVNKGTYIFDLTGCTGSNQVWKLEVFANALNAADYDESSNIVLSDAAGECNNNVKRNDYKGYESKDQNNSLQYVIIHVKKSFSSQSDWAFLHISTGSSYGGSWQDGDKYRKFYKAETVHSSDTVYYCEVSFDGSTVDYNWRTSAQKSLPDCLSATPKLTLSAGANGALGACTAGDDAIGGGANEVEPGTDVHLVAVPAEHYTFGGWVRADGSVASYLAEYDFTMPSTSLSLTATFYADNTDPSISGCSGCFRIAP